MQKSGLVKKKKLPLQRFCEVEGENDFFYN
jgi:hypothetical protein